VPTPEIAVSPSRLLWTSESCWKMPSANERCASAVSTRKLPNGKYPTRKGMSLNRCATCASATATAAQQMPTMKSDHAVTRASQPVALARARSVAFALLSKVPVGVYPTRARLTSCCTSPQCRVTTCARAVNF
jgi:hypothetical protein